MSVLVEVDNRVALNGVDLPDEKAVHVKITPPDNEVLWFELFRAWHSLTAGSGASAALRRARRGQRL